MAGKFIGGALSLYGPDGKFHYDQRYDKLYYEGEFDEISDEVKAAVDYVVRYNQRSKEKHQPSKIIRVKENGEFEILR